MNPIDSDSTKTQTKRSGTGPGPARGRAGCCRPGPGPGVGRWGRRIRHLDHSPGSACGANRDLHDGAQVPHEALAAAVRGGWLACQPSIPVIVRLFCGGSTRLTALPPPRRLLMATVGEGCHGGRPGGCVPLPPGGVTRLSPPPLGGRVPPVAATESPRPRRRGGGAAYRCPRGGGRRCRRRRWRGACHLLPPPCHRGRVVEPAHRHSPRDCPPPRAVGDAAVARASAAHSIASPPYLCWPAAAAGEDVWVGGLRTACCGVLLPLSVATRRVLVPGLPVGRRADLGGGGGTYSCHRR